MAGPLDMCGVLWSVRLDWLGTVPVDMCAGPQPCPLMCFAKRKESTWVHFSSSLSSTVNEITKYLFHQLEQQQTDNQTNETQQNKINLNKYSPKIDSQSSLCPYRWQRTVIAGRERARSLNFDHHFSWKKISVQFPFKAVPSFRSRTRILTVGDLPLDKDGLTLTFLCTLRGGSGPRLIEVEWFTLFTITTGRVVLAIAHQIVVAIVHASESWWSSSEVIWIQREGRRRKKTNKIQNNRSNQKKEGIAKPR